MILREAGSPFRPPAGVPVRWPDAFGRRFAVFVDVEEEFDWRAPFSRANRTTDAMRAFAAAHRRFAGMGAGLTCMVDHPAATDPVAIDALGGVAADPASAIGAQLHPWVTPPFVEVLSPFNSFPGNLPREVERAKIGVLTDAIATAFGRPPVAFRAGRYGLGPNTLPLLADAGYRLDSSVRPGFSYAGEGGPDFTRSNGEAARHGAVIELPLTTMFAGLGGARLHRRLLRWPAAVGAAARLHLATRVPLTPEGVPIESMLRILDRSSDGPGLLVFSFHSPSLEPGHTPYVRDARDLAAFWTWWDRVLARLAALGMRHASLAEILVTAG